MPVERVHSFLVHPSKHAEEQPTISGTLIPPHGQLHTMLEGVFDRAAEECDIDIVFRPTEDGQQQNVCRDLLVGYVQDPSVRNGRLIAARLQQVSTHRSGLGLFFLMKGTANRNHQLVISRFPADQGVIAQEQAQQLSVEFIERVFMKSAKAYKSALYISSSVGRGFWEGRAIDRQTSGSRELSDYWIREFLASELRTTGPAGTRRLAVALKSAIRNVQEPGTRHELISAANLLCGQHGHVRTARQLVQQLGLSQASTTALTAAFPRSDLMDEAFRFDRDEFKRHATYRAVELDNGGMLIAEDSRFATVFEQQVINEAEKRVRYSTEGRIVDEALRKTK